MNNQKLKIITHETLGSDNGLKIQMKVEDIGKKFSLNSAFSPIQKCENMDFGKMNKLIPQSSNFKNRMTLDEISEMKATISNDKQPMNLSDKI